jgi:hypothetical protein
MLRATNVARDQLLSLGTCFGKFTKTGKFRLHVTALDHVAPYARFKLWIKPNGELPFLYGNHVLKAHVGRMSEDIEQYAGVVLYNMADVPLVRTRTPHVGGESTVCARTHTRKHMQTYTHVHSRLDAHAHMCGALCRALG